MVGIGLEVDLGGGALSDGYMVVGKFGADGTHHWSKAFNADPLAVAIDALGNVAVAGRTVGLDPIDFGGGPLPSFSDADMFVVKFGPNGDHQWSRRCGHIDWNTLGESVSIDGSGNVIVCGIFARTVDFGGGPVTSAGVHDIFVVKYHADGIHQWTKRLGNAASEEGLAATDGAGNIVVAGKFSGAVNFGGGVITAQGSSDIFVAKYAPNGAHQWSRRFGHADVLAEQFWALAANGPGLIVMTGCCNGVVDFGGGPVTDSYLVALEPSGSHRWSKGFYVSSEAVAADALGNTVLTGHFGGTVDFGGGPLVSVSGGGADLFAVKFDAGGDHQWSQRFGGLGLQERGLGIATDLAGSFVFTGSFDGTADFGGGPLVSEADDIFLAKFGDGPVPVLITHFDATVRGSIVNLVWEIWSDETVDTYSLLRRKHGLPTSSVVAEGDARTTRSYQDESVEIGKSYAYELVVRNLDGESFRSSIANVAVPELTVSVGPNYPNPFNPSTSIEYTIAERRNVTIEIIDVSGAVVARLDQGVRDAGSHRAEWDSRDTWGRRVGSGVYFYRMSRERGVPAGKMTLLK